ncbi:hypothetical protein LSTR_LSTR004411 [Laodelphax striatellus]|uniref:Uncharacterized protein n=1 Tax=Laodelphax striatellus TaxID=195883 RepID=A0A482X9Z8_LAOST|nr:hypothetical protein LSTR_LSTR004411 [Laodelphax striatellus]
MGEKRSQGSGSDIGRRQARRGSAAVGPQGDTDGERRQRQITGITTGRLSKMEGRKRTLQRKKCCHGNSSKAGDWWTSAALHSDSTAELWRNVTLERLRFDMVAS